MKKRIKRKDNIDKAPAWAHIETDPQGMYTGCPVDVYEEPEQDADDL